MAAKRIASDYWVRQSERSASSGNSKLGKTMNISLLPAVACPPGIPCWKKCYAMKATRYQETLRRWYLNTVLWLRAPELYEAGLVRQIAKAKPKFFRWHVAGDIPDLRYLRMMRRVAEQFPKTRFLAHTKAYDALLYDTPAGSERPLVKNLQICISGWPGYREAEYKLLVDGLKFPGSTVEMKDGTGHDSTAIKCPGSCTSCRICWTFKPGKKVVFHEH